MYSRALRLILGPFVDLLLSLALLFAVLIVLNHMHFSGCTQCGLLCHFGRVFMLLGCLDGLGKCQVFILELEECFEDCFIIQRTYESCAHCFIKWVFNRSEITCDCILSYA